MLNLHVSRQTLPSQRMIQPGKGGRDGDVPDQCREKQLVTAPVILNVVEVLSVNYLIVRLVKFLFCFVCEHWGSYSIQTKQNIFTGEKI